MKAIIMVNERAGTVHIYPSIHTDYSVYVEADKVVDALSKDGKRVALLLEFPDSKTWRALLRAADTFTESEITKLAGLTTALWTSKVDRQVVEALRFARKEARRSSGKRAVYVLPIDYEDAQNVHSPATSFANTINILGQRVASTFEESFVVAQRSAEIYNRSNSIRNRYMSEKIAKAKKNHQDCVVIVGEVHYPYLSLSLSKAGINVIAHGSLSAAGKLLFDAEAAAGHRVLSDSDRLAIARYALFRRAIQSKNRLLNSPETQLVAGVASMDQAKKMFESLPVAGQKEMSGLLRVAPPKTRLKC